MTKRYAVELSSEDWAVVLIAIGLQDGRRMWELHRVIRDQLPDDPLL